MKKMYHSKLYRLAGAFLALMMFFLALPLPVQAAGGIKINITGVKKNQSVTVKGLNFPAKQRFMVRVGPYYTFARSYRIMDYVQSGKGGEIEFTVKLPDNVKEGELVAIRVDSEDGHYAYNAFYNNDKNAPSNPPAATPTPAPTSKPSSSVCQVISTSPSSSKTYPVNADLDAVWEVKNTGTTTWDAGSLDHKYLSGDKIYKFNALYDMPQSVKPGETVTIRVDLKGLQAGTYRMTWGIVSGSTTVCSLPLTLTIK